MKETLMNDCSFLDVVKTKQKTRLGVIDYCNKKQIIFYDFTHDQTPNLRIMLLLWWAGDSAFNRFSIFSQMNFPQIRLPEPIIIPISAITNDVDLSINETGGLSEKVSSNLK
jgi:hypothetical protein